MPTMTESPSMTLIDPDRTSGPVADAFAKLPVINVFRAMANATTLFPPYMDYLSQLFKQMELDKTLERMIVLHVSKLADCFYAWRQNTVVARSVGVTEEQIAALQRGEVQAVCFSAAEQAAFAFTDEVVRLVEATDLTYHTARKYFSDRALTEMLYVIGTYMFVARLVRSGRIPLDAQTAPSPQ
jgi:alkylhydroperoxidase family enzyme